jgi:lipopolysaccharide export system permease protein
VILVLFLANSFDILQKYRSIDISPQIFWQLISFKIPFLFNEVSSLIGFLSALLFLQKLTSENEMVIIISSGLPIWKVFIIPITATFLFGLIILFTINPLGTYALREYKELENIITDRPKNNFIVSQSGIFFFEDYQKINRIIQARSFNSAKGELSDVLILNVDEQNNLISRIDSPKAILSDGNFMLTSAKTITNESVENNDVIYVPTRLTVSSLMQQFLPPELIPIWQLKNSIEKFANSGLPVVGYKIYYYKQLFKPLFMTCMVFLACWFTSLNVRNNYGPKVMMMGILVGVITYFLLEIIPRILAYGGFDPMYSILLPILFIIMISNFVILHFQEA